jgi:hypothetical protein
MPFYDLDGVALTINQASGSAPRVDLVSLQQGYAQVLEEKNRRIAELERRLALAPRSGEADMGRTAEELRAIVPRVASVSLARHPVWSSEAGGAADTMVVCILRPAAGGIGEEDLKQLERWLEVKLETRKVRIYVE